MLRKLVALLVVFMVVLLAGCNHPPENPELGERHAVCDAEGECEVYEYREDGWYWCAESTRGMSDTIRCSQGAQLND